MGRNVFQKIGYALGNLKKYIVKGGVAYLTVETTAPGQQLRGKTALVTGGSSGIGKAVVKTFLQQGAKVVFTGNSKEHLDEAETELNSSNAIGLQADISDVRAHKQVMEKCFSLAGGNIHILVNNAGVLTRLQFGDMPDSEWNRVMEINAKGLYFFTQEYISQLLEKSKPGKILNISSMCGILPTTTPYGLSKWMVEGFTKGLAKQYIEKGIIVNGIAPGNVATRMNAIDPASNAYTTENAHARIILPEEVAELTLFLASERSNSIIGQTIVIDGGTSLP